MMSVMDSKCVPNQLVHYSVERILSGRICVYIFIY